MPPIAKIKQNHLCSITEYNQLLSFIPNILRKLYKVKSTYRPYTDAVFEYCCLYNDIKIDKS
nr:MAG TPA: hypothetical protein [Microviridae sp.]